MTTDNFCFQLQNRLIQTSKTRDQWYSDTSPFSIPWSNFQSVRFRRTAKSDCFHRSRKLRFRYFETQKTLNLRLCVFAILRFCVFGFGGTEPKSGANPKMISKILNQALLCSISLTVGWVQGLVL